MQEIKTSVKDYILWITFGGDGQDISSGENLRNRKPSPEWASFFQNLLKSSLISRVREDKGKNDGENREKGFSPPETPGSSLNGQMREDVGVSRQKKPGERRSRDFSNSQKMNENGLDGFISFSNMQNDGENARKDEGGWDLLGSDCSK
jgi:hypothetical protein